ncbi:MAG TPA: hypothetical protein VF589_10860 [Allosphingosinicella sp.]
MDRDQAPNSDDLPQEDGKSDERAEQAKKELDEVPEPGTDPLHEGP